MEIYVVSGDTFTAEVPREIKEHDNFKKWLENTDNTQLIRVGAFKEKILSQGLVTNAKNLKDGLYERKWKSGLRVYFAIIQEADGRKTLILLGSGKDREQYKSILVAKNELKKYRVVKEDIKFNPGK